MIFDLEIVIYTDVDNMDIFTLIFVNQGGLYEPYQFFTK